MGDYGKKNFERLQFIQLIITSLERCNSLYTTGILFTTQFTLINRATHCTVLKSVQHRQGRRYQALTRRYGYQIVQQIRRSGFLVIFKKALDQCSFSYVCPYLRVRAQYFLPWLRCNRLKFFFLQSPIQILRKSPHYTAAILFCDVISDKAHTEDKAQNSKEPYQIQQYKENINYNGETFKVTVNPEVVKYLMLYFW